MIRTIAADDHFLIRYAVKRMLEKTPDIRLVCEAENGRQLLEKLSRDEFDVLLLDISMPGPDVFDLLGEVRAVAPNLPVLVLSMHAVSQYAAAVIKAGAAGYLNKSCALADIVDGIRRLYAGRQYITAEVSEQLCRHSAGKAHPVPHHRLTEREYQVMCRIAAGQSLSQIARELHLSP
ncbi:MAG: response regulator, partial [Thermodesulfobacteriota bacterium]